MISIRIFDVVALISLTIAVVTAYHKFVLSNRRGVREWCYNMHQYSQEVIPFSPLEVQSNYDALGKDPDAYIESYRGSIEAIPTRMNERRLDAPDGIHMSGDIIELLYNEGENIQKQIETLEENSGFEFFEFLESIGVMHAVSLAIQHEMEENIIESISRMDVVLLVIYSTRQRDVSESIDTVKMLYSFEADNGNKKEVLELLSEMEGSSIKPLPSQSKEHTENLYKDFREKTHPINSIRRSLLDSYMNTYNRPWVSPLVRTNSRYR